jgi:RND family efflux transporter MFP subunit
MAPEKNTLDELRIHRPASPARTPRTTIVTGVAALVLVALALIWWSHRPRAVPVRTARAQPVAAGGATTLLNASGYVTARRAATVSSKVTGQVVSVLIEEGMKVTEGQLLARLDASNVEASLHLAEAQLESTRKATGETAAALKLAQDTLRRTMELAGKKVISDSALDSARADAATLQARLQRQQADVEVAERGLAVWQQQLDDTVIRAPFAGVVTAKNAQPGEMISPMSAGGSFTRTGICTVVDMGSLEIEIDVNESYINRVEPGQPVEATLDAYPDWKIPCHVIAIIPTADRDKSTVRVRVGFDQLDPRILPEMSVKVAFREAAGGPNPTAARTVMVPKAAIQQQNGRDMVMIVRDERAERRAVTVRNLGATEAEISAGVAPGERVVVDAPKELTDGAAVKEINP